MKDQDRFDWEDNEDFADLNGNLGASPVEEDFPVDSLSDFDSISSFDDLDPLDASVAESAGTVESEFGEELTPADQDNSPSEVGQPAEEQAAAQPIGLYRNSRRAPIWVVSFVFLFLPLVTAGGLGYALLLALGGQPAALWNSSGFLPLESVFDFQQNPLHLFYLASLGTVVLALLAGKLAAHLMGKDQRRLRRMEDLLDRLTSLRLDDEKAWQNPRFRSDTAVASFVTEILGAWRFQQSRQRKYIGLEGELMRLERALDNNTKDALSERFDNPIAGSLADEMIRVFDDLEAAHAEAKSGREKDEHEAHTIIGLIQDSRSWNRHTFDQVSVQGVCLERVSSHLKDLKRQVESAAKAEDKVSGPEKSLSQLAKELGKVAATGQNSSLKGTAAALRDLVDRCSKLAFQIAMEVARLGPRGERLLPMTQNLEALTTEFRKMAEQMGESKSATGGLPTPIKKIQQQLTALAGSLAEAKSDNLKSIGALAAEIVPDAHSVALNLADIAVSFNNQDDRLTIMGEALGELTGAHFDVDAAQTSDPDATGNSGLEVTGNNPFFSGTSTKSIEPEVDPFKPQKPAILGGGLLDSAEGIEITSAPGKDMGLDNAEELPVPDKGDSTLDLELPGDVPQADPGVDLSSDQEMVYNLEDLGGQALANDRKDMPAEDEVHDISEFGGQPLVPGADSGSGQEPVFDLNDLGAQRVDATEAGDVAAEGKIYELTEFGAQRLADSAEVEGEEKVYDLSELGAVALI